VSETNVLTYALVADGSSDRALLPILLWSLRRCLPSGTFGPPTFHPRRSRPVAEALTEVLTNYAPDIVFVHRDAEGLSREERRAEIPATEGTVAVVPVRMTETWLLADEQAIRKASGNPNGSVALSLPELRRLESVPNPKTVLRDLLVRASEYSGRRRRAFDRGAAISRLASLIDDFSPLMKLSAFQSFVSELESALHSASHIP
jgi:hypothetical protein